MRFLTTLLAAGTALVGAACLAAGADHPRDAGPVRTFHGAAVPLGRGTARTYITVEGNRPVELGVALSAAALSGLPAGDGTADHKHGVSFFEYLLELPADNPTPYRFVELDWNPGGHEPPGIYGRPHFDFHFYTVDRAIRDEIVPEHPGFASKGARLPPAEYLPRGYIVPEPLIVPKMGQHWIDVATPEINGTPFTTTFLYGSWDGRLIFAEPMITKAFIEATADTTIPVGVPARYEVAGYYPTRYRVRFDADAREYRIALTGFVWHGDER